jgi:hypothetical protein
LHTASDIRDSEAPDQPKRAKAKATVSDGEDGRATVELEELNRLDGRRSRMLLTDGSGYVMFSRRGRSLATALNDW